MSKRNAQSLVNVGKTPNSRQRAVLPSVVAHASQIGVLFATTFGSAFLTFLTQVILVRVLSVPDYGQLVALLAFINLLTPLSTYGVGWFWLRVFGEEGWAGFRWIAPSVRLMTLTCTLATIALLAFTFWHLSSSDRFLAGALAIPVLFGQVFTEITSARLQLEERFVALAFWQPVTQTGRFVVSAGLFAVGAHDGIGPVAGYGGLGLIITIIGSVSLRQLQRGNIVLRGHGSRLACSEAPTPQPSLRRIVREATPFCLWTVFYSLSFQGVIILLAVLVGKPEAAVYNVAYQIMAAVYLIPSVIYSSYLFGKVFRWSEHDVGRFFAAFHVGVFGMTILGLASMVAVAVISPILIPILFGEAYAASIPIIVVLSITIPLRFVQTAYASLYYSKENMKWQVAYSGSAALFCITLNAILLPKFGLPGALVTQGATEALLLGLYMRGAKRINGAIRIWRSFHPATVLQAVRTLSAAAAE